jgi:hypothetical protein
MIRLIAIAYAGLISLAAAQDATVYVTPKIPTEAEKILALKLGYELNGRSMVRWGAIDLTGPTPVTVDDLIGPPPPSRVIPMERRK